MTFYGLGLYLYHCRKDNEGKKKQNKAKQDRKTSIEWKMKGTKENVLEIPHICSIGVLPVRARTLP